MSQNTALVFGGEPGRSNYANLRAGGGSACNDVAGADRNLAEMNWAANRTPYWQPALLDGKGNVVLVDYVSFYYKRRPASDPVVSDPSNSKYEGQAVKLPNGIKFIFGATPSDSNKPIDPGAALKITCNMNGGTQAQSDFPTAVQCVRTNAGAQLEIRMEAPSCWDGVNLDSPDHRSHVAYPSCGSWGYPRCDAQHPSVIPTYTYAAFYTLLSTDDGDIHLASDEMNDTKPRGWSFHVDYGPAAWDPIVLGMWTDNCIDKLLNCSGGDLGNGFRLKGAAQPIYYDNGNWTNLVDEPDTLGADAVMSFF